LVISSIYLFRDEQFLVPVKPNLVDYSACGSINLLKKTVGCPVKEKEIFCFTKHRPLFIKSIDVIFWNNKREIKLQYLERVIFHLFLKYRLIVDFF